MKPKGWRGESRRHSMARKGVSTVIDQDRRLAVNKFVARGDNDKSEFYNDGFTEGEFSAMVNIGEDRDELIEAYKNGELGEIVGEVREHQTQMSGDISYDVKFFDKDIDVLEWLNKSDDMRLFDEGYAVEQVIKKFNINPNDAERIVGNWKSGGISVENYEDWENGFYKGFYNAVRLEFLDGELMGVWDNGGESVDRYSIIYKDGDLVGMSERPSHPQGFSQFSGNVHEWGLKDFDHLGTKISVRDVPDEVLDAIEQRIGDE